MTSRQPLPRLWMMTDERQGDSLLASAQALPRGSGIVLRHYGLAEGERHALFGRLRAIARRRGLILLIAGPPNLARRWSAVGSHGQGGRPIPGQIRTASVHNLHELRLAEVSGADLVFISPVFPTRSHPGGRTLGPRAFASLARQARLPAVALGGMDARNARILKRSGAYGWAAVDAWSVRDARQKRKAVPI